jgi:long-chain acyl-CoA synthetase
MRWQALNQFATLPDLLQYVLNAYSNSYAFNYREAGYWRHLSTEQFCGDVRRFCLGLIELGLKPGDTVGILAEPSPFWLVADLGTMIAGGISVPLFPNMSDEHLVFESKNSNLKYLVVIGEKQWKLVEKHAKLYHKVITKSVAARDRHAIDYAQLLEMGDEASEKDPTLFARLRDTVTADRTATIIHTSGSTGVPKGVVLTHKNFCAAVHSTFERFPLDPVKDRALTCLPLAHIFERVVMYGYIGQGIAIYFCDDVKSVGPLLREVKPTAMTMVPRIVEKLYARIEQQVEVANALKKSFGRWAIKLAVSQPPTEKLWRMTIADAFVYKKLRGALGGQLKYLILGGAPLSQDLYRFLINIGIPLYIGYGLTETTAAVTANYPGNRKMGSVGKPMPGVEVRLSGQKEILIRGAIVMKEYHRNPSATAEVIDKEGWFHSGDLGEIDADGYLSITGRIKELLKTSNGKYVSPVPIEQSLAASNLIDMAMIIAEGRQCVSCLLWPDLEFVRARKAESGTALNEEDYLKSGPLRHEVEALVARVNRNLDHWEKIRHWRMVLTPPSVESDELTPTMKLRRHIISAKYGNLIDEMYREPEGAGERDATKATQDITP